ncbi:hypothetical protein M3152_14600 [Sporosarcina luteola]|uniref:hypothetical protein n=1 Tax=Sporosarcina luteola TaxID=582850 RepID=UPI00203EF04C|nr:hypothetical protein [Sporosarcina luteola]MCM3638930.1 hypothetical protein [Sporosarcina luteola]
MQIDKTIHLPDLSFIRLCNEKYGVNRGLYNTIDTFFYERGFERIVERRKIILSFLDYVQEGMDENTSRTKFGSGGLKIKIDEYFSEVEKHREKSIMATC